MEDYRRYFQPVLDDDEQLIEVFKPNKRKLYTSTLLAVMLSITFMAAFAAIALFIGELPLYALIPLGVWLFVLIITLILLPIYYNNLYYAYTDKRLITRTGIFGIDYRFLIMDSIGAVNVYVSLLDKLVAQNTGSLIFGSMSAPLMQTENASGSGYRFNHIDLPYDQYKKIKGLIQKERLNNGQQ